MRHIDWPPPRSAIAATFDRRAGVYDESALHQFLTRRAVEEADLFPRMNVLDLASGSGLAIRHVASSLKGQGLFVAADIARDLLKSARPTAHAIVADADALPFTAGAFDLVLCVSAFAYFPDPVAVLKEIRSLLRENGQLVFQVYAADGHVPHRVFRRTAMQFGLMFTDPDVRLGSEENCLTALEAAGFPSAHIVSDVWTSNLPSAEDFWNNNAPLFADVIAGIPEETARAWRGEFFTAYEKERRALAGVDRQAVFFVKASPH